MILNNLLRGIFVYVRVICVAFQMINPEYLERGKKFRPKFVVQAGTSSDRNNICFFPAVRSSQDWRVKCKTSAVCQTLGL
jgi:hypothetical protein